MASGKLLRKLVRAGTEGDSDRFRKVAEEVIQIERSKQHHLLANDLERILYGRSQQPSVVDRLVDDIPCDAERGLPLLHLREPVRQLDNIVLTTQVRDTVESILLEYRRVEELATFGLRAAKTVLFFGPPGCGKTVTAEAIAYELERPLATIRLDSLVSSFLGQTAGNLRSIFEFIGKVPCVALFDEFDAIAKTRSDGAEHGELRRVVNAVLQMMDDYTGETLIIAATNHEQMLDSAIWRRFEEVLQFEPPTRPQLEDFLLRRLSGVRLDVDIDALPLEEWFDGWAFADIERVLARAVKEMILSGEQFLRRRHLESSVAKESSRRERIQH